MAWLAHGACVRKIVCTATTDRHNVINCDSLDFTPRTTDLADVPVPLQRLRAQHLPRRSAGATRRQRPRRRPPPTGVLVAALCRRVRDPQTALVATVFWRSHLITFQTTWGWRGRRGNRTRRPRPCAGAAQRMQSKPAHARHAPQASGSNFDGSTKMVACLSVPKLLWAKSTFVRVIW
jgi:hypothetical protein